MNSPIWVFNKSQIKEKIGRSVTACSKSHTSVYFACVHAEKGEKTQDGPSVARAPMDTSHLQQMLVTLVAEVVSCR